MLNVELQGTKINKVINKHKEQKEWKQGNTNKE